MNESGLLIKKNNARTALKYIDNDAKESQGDQFLCYYLKIDV